MLFCVFQQWIFMVYFLNMQTTKKIFRTNFIFPYLLGMALSFTQGISNFSCNFEDTSCKWTQNSSDDFCWSRRSGHPRTIPTGPTTDHTKGDVILQNKKQGPGSIQHRERQCIHVFGGAYNRPVEGQSLVLCSGCGEGMQEFRLLPNGLLMLTRYGMCVKPKLNATGAVPDGVQVGIFNNCDATDKWDWTTEGWLLYNKKMCLRPETRVLYSDNDVPLVVDSACNASQNFAFLPTRGWYMYIKASSSMQPNDTARLFSPSTRKNKSCLQFYYHMYGHDVGKLQVYVKSGGNMGLPVWSRYGDHRDIWYQAKVPVNNQNTSYQYVIEGVRGNGSNGDIAIDDITLMDSCAARAIVKDDHKGIIIISTTVGAGVFLSIVLIVLFVKYKRWKRAPKLSTPVNISMEANEYSPELLSNDEVASHEDAVNVDREFLEDDATSAEGRESLYEMVQVPSNARSKKGMTVDVACVLHTREEPQYETPGENETYKESEISQENPGYTELDKNRLHGRNAADDCTYQKLLRRDSDYVIPAHERRNSDYVILAHEGKDSDYAIPDHEGRDSDHVIPDHEGRDSDHVIPDHEGRDSDYVIPDHEGRDSDHVIPDHERRDSDHVIPDHEGKDSDYVIPDHEGRDSDHVIPDHEGRDSDHVIPDHEGRDSDYVIPDHEGRDSDHVIPDHEGRNSDPVIPAHERKDSDYVISAHERRESYEDIKMQKSQQGYKELCQNKREAEEYPVYQSC